MRLSPKKLEDLIIISDNADVLNNFGIKLVSQPSSARNPFSRIQMTVLSSNNNVLGGLSNVFATDEFMCDNDEQFTSEDDSD